MIPCSHIYHGSQGEIYSPTVLLCWCVHGAIVLPFFSLMCLQEPTEMELVDDEIGVAVEFHEDEDEREDEGEMDEIVVGA